MFPKHTKLLAISVTALTLGACATKQNPAPVVSGLDNNSYNTTSNITTGTEAAVTNNVVNSNPYGASPYNPNITDNSVSTEPTIGNPNDTNITTTNTTSRVKPDIPYIGNYSPVDINANTHVVEAGDTVYNIAKRYHISQDDLRTWNNIGTDNAIRLGQALRVKPIGNTVPATATVTNTATTPIISNNKREVSGITWQSPTNGKIIKSFGQGADKIQKNGIYLSGKRGQPVVAAADGTVVYSGRSLRDYGNLIIIQHNSKYLTAYGSNEAPLLVNEGQKVKRGQQIATMGDSDKFGTLKLHFEIREYGTAKNPSEFIGF